MAEKTKLKNQVQKLLLRQVRGCLQPWQRSNPIRFFTKYSRNCCFKLSDLLDSQGEIKNGHVILGFTKDGSHLISYSLVIDTRLELPCPTYCYILHWWRFRYNKPLIKAHSVPLFHNQSISDALHLIISQSLDEKQVIVWGRSFTSPEDQSCRCYVTICASIPTKPCAACRHIPSKKCVEHSFAVHFSYETLPPYPVFLPSISLRIPGVVLFNCGDSLVAMNCTPCSKSAEQQNVMQDCRKLGKMTHTCKLRQQTWDETVDKSDKHDDKSDEELCENMVEMDCLNVTRIDTANTPTNCDDFVKKERQDRNSNDLVSLDQLKGDTDTTLSSQLSTATSPFQSTSQVVKDSNNSGYQTKYSFKTYSNNNGGFTTAFEECDVIDREIPVSVVCNGEMELHHTSMPSHDIPAVTVCQAFLDMEECINELIESHKDLRGRYKSLCDYDSQFLSACPDTGDVVVMVIVLIYAKPTNSCFSEGLQVSPSAQLQRTGFVFSWNIWNGVYQTLHYLDVESHPHGKDFSKSEYSIISSRRLRRETAVPVGFTSQVRVFSNHTVFTEKSLKYLLHPFLPIVLVL